MNVASPIKQWAEKKTKPAGRTSTALLKAFDKLTDGLQFAKDKAAYKQANLAKLRALRVDLAASDDPGATYLLDGEIGRWERG